MGSKTPTLFGIILAAGRARRMQGRIKALLKLNNKTFIEKIIGDFRRAGINNIIVVLGYKNDKVREFLTEKGLAGKVTIVINRNFNAEQMASLKKAVKTLPKQCRAIMFTPVDHPLTKLPTYRAVIKSWQKDKKKMHIPSYNYRKGHPAVFPREIFEKMLTDKIDGGARTLLTKYPEKVKYVNVKDPTIVMDFDYLKDLKGYNKKR